ncbi:serine/threonine-protein kinase mos-like [Actinia tenebrosa]|uniref:non-specific serine/threonine protein kinase n=1 Tax=Actinia tenebrosa TaxID=6105 RepID=A0A6P8HXY8_ACTTE|nr:serine/threonine-protein kinase mos-like [Actinia tenebrosa]
MVLQRLGSLFCENSSHSRREMVHDLIASGNFETSELKIGKLLGSGGFGSVYETVFRGERLALKKLHKGLKNERAARESFEAETSVLKFAHPNIVRTFALLVICDTNCIIMEYAGDRNLQNVINDSFESLTAPRRTKFALDIAHALDYAHEKGIVHLDLKPSNVMVSCEDHCKLADFGCCQAVEVNDKPASPTKSNLTGTYAYRAPELLRGECPTTKADIYSYGICLWQMLTRELPYGNQNQHVIIFGVVAYQLRPKLSGEINTCDEEYVNLIQQCWEADPKQRPLASEIVVKVKNVFRTYDIEMCSKDVAFISSEGQQPKLNRIELCGSQSEEYDSNQPDTYSCSF